MKSFSKIYLAAVLMAAVCGCSQLPEPVSPAEVEPVSDTGGDASVLYASIDSPQTRTSLEKADGDMYKSVWSEGDEICVFFDGASAGADFKLKKGEGLANASFEGYGSGTSWMAVYPTKDAESFDGTDIHLKLPEIQTYVQNSFGPDSYPMIAAETQGNMVFRNLCSILRVQLTGGHIVKSIKFTAADTGAGVSGEAVVNPVFSTEPALKMASDASNSVTLETGETVLDQDEPTGFCIVLPAQTYKGGFSLEIVTTTGTMNLSTTKDVTLTRSNVHSITPHKVKVDEGTDPSQYLEGEGTGSDPFVISSLSDFMAMASALMSSEGVIRNKQGKKAAANTSAYKLACDLDLSPACSQQLGSWIPMGTGDGFNGDGFCGSFDGNGHKISNLYCNSEQTRSGLFGTIVGEIKNLTVIGYAASPSTATSESCGLVAGLVGYDGIVENCQAYGQVEAKCAGGLVGCVYGKVTGCTNYATVDGTSYAGGLTGYMQGDGIYNCANFGSVSSESKTGGIVGFMRYGSKTVNCVNYGDVYAAEGYIGGIVAYSNPQGWDGQTIANCVNVGSVLTPKQFIGTASAVCASWTDTDIKQCYWLYDPDSDGNKGCKVGLPGGVESCYGVTLARLNGEAPCEEVLYTNKDGGPSMYVPEALNNWAADNGTEYWGWELKSGDEYLSLTGEPAKGGVGDVSDVFIVSPTDVYVSYTDETFEVKVTAGMGHKISSMPDWISVESTDQTGSGKITATVYTFKASANPDYVERSGVIVLCNDAQQCVPVTVTQMEKIGADDVWKIKNFYHRSVGFKFTATWCGYCPAMATEWDFAQSVCGDKFIIAAFHPTSSDLGFAGTSKLEEVYNITGYPTGIVDGRASVYSSSIVKPVIDETESAYGTSSGIEFESTVSGNSVNLDVNLYIHEKGDYKITALLVEDGIIAYQADYYDEPHPSFKHDNIVRLAFTDVSGDAFAIDGHNLAKSFSYSGTIPSGCNSANMRVLVYVQRSYGDRAQVKKVSGASYGSYGDYYIDNANDAALGEKAKAKYDDGSAMDEQYESTDYSLDGVATKLMSATVGNGIDIIITGDAFADKDQNVFDAYAARAADAFFAIEPYKSLRDRFNVWKVNAVSDNDQVGGATKFSTYFGDGTLVGGNNDYAFRFAEQYVPGIDLTKTLVIVLVNKGVYAGTNWCYTDNRSVCYVPLQTSLDQFDATLRHEASGHGFGKLDDEYAYDGEAPSDWISDRMSWQTMAYGFWENVDFTSDPETIRWNAFISDSRYNGSVGVYEGGGTYATGVWRPTLNSIMRYNYGYFNAPSREAIYKKIMRFSEGDDWTYDYETFVAFDAKGRTEEAGYTYPSEAYGTVAGVEREFVPLHPPVLVK